MYAQIVEGGASPELRNEMDRVVREELIPALQQEAGFSGAMNLVNRQSGEAMMITLWATEEQAGLPPQERGLAFLKALAAIAAISSGQRRPISTWEINARV